MSFNVLITSASRKVSLVKSFREALGQTGGGGVIAADLSPMAAALYFADEHVLLPPDKDPGFVDTVLELCIGLGVKLVVPTRDEELPVFSTNRERFLREGIRIMVASPDIVAICQDKLLFSEFCLLRNIPVPLSIDVRKTPSAYDFPLFLKPRFGKGSRNAVKVCSEEELRLAIKRCPDCIVQEYIKASEYTIDLFADFDGRVLSVVPRERLLVFGGESFVAKTRKIWPVIDEAARLSSILGLVGHNTIQCFYDDGGVRFIEVNPRYGGAASLGFAAGAHTPLMLVKLAKGYEVNPMIGEFTDNLVMARYTEDFIREESFFKQDDFFGKDKLFGGEKSCG
ncbi:MAG: ATP-grasp domain-containing protein [Nitrospirae bacterium]|nr:ATP-grasp domain-containing protein [Nitrospirota bacterium]